MTCFPGPGPHCHVPGAVGFLVVTRLQAGGSWYIDMSWIMKPRQPASAEQSLPQDSGVACGQSGGRAEP